MLAILDEVRLRRVLARLLDPNEFLSDYGIRSLSRYHSDQPVVVRNRRKGLSHRLFPRRIGLRASGQNGNWRGPIWMPKTRCCSGADSHVHVLRKRIQSGMSDRFRSLDESVRSGQGNHRPGGANIFCAEGRTPAGGRPGLASSNGPSWPNHLLFYEYFDGDTGAGLGASHQTGWTGLAPAFVYLFETLNAESVLKEGFLSFVSAIAGARKPEGTSRAEAPFDSEASAWRKGESNTSSGVVDQTDAPRGADQSMNQATTRRGTRKTNYAKPKTMETDAKCGGDCDAAGLCRM